MRTSIQFTCLVLLIFLVFGGGHLWAGDLPEVQQQGVLRHLGVPYSHFVSGTGDGLDVELVQGFARHLGVRYEYVPTTWVDFVGDLTGQRHVCENDMVKKGEKTPVRGDIAAHGITILPWRQQVMKFSSPTFPTQVWVLARADSRVKPITPTNQVKKDIAAVRVALRRKTLLGIPNTCLDPKLFGLSALGVKSIYFSGNLNELTPALIKAEAELALLDSPDSLIALAKWPGKVKVIGPLTPDQHMAAAFPRTSPQLVEAFNEFLKQSQNNGVYLALVRKYYPTVFQHFPGFFKNMQ